MIDPKEFLLEDTEEERRLKSLSQDMDGVKQLANSYARRALNLYKRIKEDDPSPTLAGKAITFLTVFAELAKITKIKLSPMQESAIKVLTEKLGGVAIKIEEDRHKVVIEHRRDPKGIDLEKEKLAVRAAEDAARSKRSEEIKIKEEEAEVSNKMVDDVARGLKSLGFKDPHRRAKLVYKEGVGLEELIVEGCRVPDA